jgi:hypothetical protein
MTLQRLLVPTLLAIFGFAGSAQAQTYTFSVVLKSRGTYLKKVKISSGLPPITYRKSMPKSWEAATTTNVNQALDITADMVDWINEVQEHGVSYGLMGYCLGHPIEGLPIADVKFYYTSFDDVELWVSYVQNGQVMTMQLY